MHDGPAERTPPERSDWWQDAETWTATIEKGYAALGRCVLQATSTVVRKGTASGVLFNFTLAHTSGCELQVRSVPT